MIRSAIFFGIIGALLWAPWMDSASTKQIATEAFAAFGPVPSLCFDGDGVMLHSTDPGRLIETAVELIEALPRAGLPPAHVGIHAGPLIERDGDYFGRTVNVAARIAAQASQGEVLVSEEAAARASASLHLTELPPVSLRGVSEPVVLYRVERS